MCMHSHMHAQTEWLWRAGLFLTYHLLHHIIFHSAEQQQQQRRIFSFTALFWLLCFCSLSRIQLAFKQGLLWQGVNPARGISPSPTKLLLLAFECQCAFLALPDELLDAHHNKKMAFYKSSFESLGKSINARLSQEGIPTLTCVIFSLTNLLTLFVFIFLLTHIYRYSVEQLL